MDSLNFGFDGESLRRDPAFLTKVAANVRALKADGLIRCASADTFAGEAALLAAVGTGAFDSIFLNFNLGNDGAARKVLPACAARGMAVVAREVFLKGSLWPIGAEAGVADHDSLSRVAVKWILRHPEVTVAVVGIDRPEQLAPVLAAASEPAFTSEDDRVLASLLATPGWSAYRSARLKEFGV